MEIPQITPQRQKMLMGSAAAGLLLVLGFSFAPELEVAEQPSGDLDEVLAIVDQDREHWADRRDPADRHPLRGQRDTSDSDDTAPKSVERPREIPLAAIDAELKQIEKTQVVPPAYQQRLELLAEEEAVLARHHRRRVENEAAEPAPSVTVASVDAIEDQPNEVEHALASARRPAQLQRVALIEGTASQSAAPSAAPRGAWLSGSIESD